MGVKHIRIGTSSLLDGAKNQECIGSQRQLILDELISKVSAAMKTRKSSEINKYTSKVKFFMSSWEEQEESQESLAVNNIGSFINSSTKVNRELDKKNLARIDKKVEQEGWRKIPILVYTNGKVYDGQGLVQRI